MNLVAAAVYLFCLLAMIGAIIDERERGRHANAAVALIATIAVAILGPVAFFGMKRDFTRDQAAALATNMIEHAAAYAHGSPTRMPFLPVGTAYATTRLNLRAAPSSQSAQLVELDSGEAVVLVRSYASGDQYLHEGPWFRVTARSILGWAHGAYLRPIGALERSVVLGESGVRRALRAILPQQSVLGKLWSLALAVVIGTAMQVFAAKLDAAETVRQAAVLLGCFLSGVFTFRVDLDEMVPFLMAAALVFAAISGLSRVLAVALFGGHR